MAFNRWNYGYAHELSSCFDASLYGPWADQPHRKGSVPFRNVSIACSDSEGVRVHAQRDQRGVPGRERPAGGRAAAGDVRLELKERFGDRPVRTVAEASLLEDGTVEVTGEPTNVDFLANFRVHDRAADRWVSKEEDPELWFELIPGHINTPFRWAERAG